MLKRMYRVMLLALVAGMMWGCGGERVTRSDEQAGRPLSKLAVQQDALHAVVIATVDEHGAPISGALVEFSRAIAGQEADYTWLASTDGKGRARVEIASDNVTGYYRARASQDGREIGFWSSIPINGGYEVALNLPIGGNARVTASSMLTPPKRAIKIGFIYTTPNRKNSLEGATLAAIQLNEAGGVRGMPIELIDGGVPIQILAKNNISDTEYVAALAEKLIVRENAFAIVGPNRSRHAVIVAEIAQRHRVPMMTTSATNPTITATGDFVFMAAFTDDFQGAVMAEFAARELGASRAAILTHRGDVYSEGLSQTFTDNFGALGGHVVAHQFYMSGETDFTAQLTAIARAAPDVVFVPGFVDEVPRVVRQAKQDIGITAAFLGGDSWDNSALVAAGGEVFEGSFFSSLFSSRVAPGDLSEDAHEFIAAYTARFGVAPDGGAALGYDALRLVVQAMRRAQDLTPEAIRDQIAATHNYSGATFISGYDENRHTAKSAIINRIANGEVQFHTVISP